MLTIGLYLTVGIAVLVTAVFLGYGRERSWERIAGSPDLGRFDLVTVARSPTANDAIAASTGLRSDIDIELPLFEEDASVLLQTIASTITEVDPLARRVDDGADDRHLRYVTYSPGMRFPDLVNIEAISVGDGRTGIILYARAQLGRIDFGANKKRLELYVRDL